MKHDEDRAARKARKQAVFKQWAKEVSAKPQWSASGVNDDGLETRAIGTMHPSIAAMQFVKEALSEYNIPGVKFRFAGMRHVGTAAQGDTLRNGVITIQAELSSTSGVRQYVDVPVIVNAGRMIYPEVLIHNGQPRVLAQSTIDDLVHRGDVQKVSLDRTNMFAPPNKTPAGKPSIAHQGPWTSVTAAANDSDPSEQAHLDPAERDRSDYLAPNQSVSLANEVIMGLRGGTRIRMPAGTKGTVVRDMFGDDSIYYVDVEGFGKAPIARKDLK